MTWKQMKRAWSRAEKNRMMTFLQLAGLAGGLACCILIYLWVADERQIDHFGKNDDRLYQVLENTLGENDIQTSENTPGLLASALATELPEAEMTVPVVPVSGSDRQAIVSAGDTEIYADAQFAGKNFFHVFAYPLIDGDADQVLANRNQVVLSKSLALKLFHRSAGLIGKTITCNQQDTAAMFVISGIFDNSVSRSSAPFDLLLPYDLFLDKNQKLLDWRSGEPKTFVLLKNGITAESVNRKLEHFLKQKDPAIKATLFAQNYSDKYLHNHYENGRPSGGRSEYVTLFSIVAFVILFIACVNFINLAGAFATEKMKDVGGKEVAGDSQNQIAWKFLGESMGMCTLALTLALLLVFFSLPAFNAITGKQLSLQPDLKMIAMIALATLVTGVGSGLYPAIYLSGFQPMAAIKGRLKQTGNREMLQKVLLVIPFLFQR